MLTATFAPAREYEFQADHLRIVAQYGLGLDGEGMILDCPESPHLSAEDLDALYGANHDGAPGDPEDLHVISEPDHKYRARIAEFERLDWEREREVEARELALHNAQVLGYAWPTSWA